MQIGAVITVFGVLAVITLLIIEDRREAELLARYEVTL